MLSSRFTLATLVYRFLDFGWLVRSSGCDCFFELNCSGKNSFLVVNSLAFFSALISASSAIFCCYFRLINWRCGLGLSVVTRADSRALPEFILALDDFEF